MIKVINLISLLAAPILVQYALPDPRVMVATAIFILILVGMLVQNHYYYPAGAMMRSWLRGKPSNKSSDKDPTE
jgi:hypothetical protein